jgi:hypothetical protein
VVVINARVYDSYQRAFTKYTLIMEALHASLAMNIVVRSIHDLAVVLQIKARIEFELCQWPASDDSSLNGQGSDSVLTSLHSSAKEDVLIAVEYLKHIEVAMTS